MTAATDAAASDSLAAPHPQWLHALRSAYFRLVGTGRLEAVRASPSAGVIRTLTVLATLSAVTIATIIPAAWYFVAEARLRGDVEVRARVFADRVADEARRNPALLEALAGSASRSELRDPDFGRDAEDINAATEQRRVFALNGAMLIDTAASVPPAWPVLIARCPVTDGAKRLGEVELSRSLRPALIVTVVLACGSSCLGLLMFLLLRIAPLRMLAAAIDLAASAALHDRVTALPNRQLFFDRLEQAVVRARRDGGRVGLLHIDIEHLAPINDLLGHRNGDAMLRLVADRLRTCLRASDTLARLGDTEFAVIQPGIKREKDVNVLGRRLLAAVQMPIELDGQPQHVGISIGVTVSDAGTPNLPDQLMKQAGIALFQAKQQGPGQCCFFAPAMMVKLREDQALVSDLRAAVVNQTLVLHYQPQVDLQTGGVVGAEALLRWRRPGFGMVPPGQFIELAEDIGMIVPIGLWALREACTRASTWPARVGIAVNVSPLQLQHPEFCKAVVAIIRETGIAPSRLELEVTEGILMRDTKETLVTLQNLRDLGIKLAVDDFGTGYSSLGYLQKFRFDKIKIDRSFVSRLGQEPGADSIVRAIIGIAVALGARAIAEGVETNAQADLLRAYGCPEAQGYLYGRPVTGEVLERRLSAGPMPVSHQMSNQSDGAATRNAVFSSPVADRKSEDDSTCLHCHET
jgi:diguanylate cyclase (GGDEF)-like protein